MKFIDKIKRIQAPKFSFGKSTEFARLFAEQIDACSMYRPGFGIGLQEYLPDSTKIWSAFTFIHTNHGVFLFNINGVNLQAARKGFDNYDEADEKRMITEWELSIIIGNKDFLKKTIIHNEKVEFKQVYNFGVLRWT